MKWLGVSVGFVVFLLIVAIGVLSLWVYLPQMLVFGVVFVVGALLALLVSGAISYWTRQP
jgi:hypothetical protein